MIKMQNTKFGISVIIYNLVVLVIETHSDQPLKMFFLDSGDLKACQFIEISISKILSIKFDQFWIALYIAYELIRREWGFFLFAKKLHKRTRTEPSTISIVISISISFYVRPCRQAVNAIHAVFYWLLIVNHVKNVC